MQAVERLLFGENYSRENLSQRSFREFIPSKYTRYTVMCVSCIDAPVLLATVVKVQWPTVLLLRMTHSADVLWRMARVPR